MNKIFKIKTMLLISSLAIAATQGYAVETHHNLIYLSANDDAITDIKFVPDGQMDISSGQPYNGTNVSNTHNWEVAIDVVAGRHKTKSVANSFMDGFTEDNLTTGSHGALDAKKPSELNFWISGDLYINGNKIKDSVRIGQGSSWSSNDWWIENKNEYDNHCGQAGSRTITDVSGNEYCIYRFGNTEGNNLYFIQKEEHNG